MKGWLIGLVVIIVLTSGIWIYRIIRPPSLSVPTSQLTLQDLPGKYCPTKAEVIVQLAGSAAVRSDSIIPISSCTTVDLSALRLSPGLSHTLTVKLPQALAFKLTAMLGQNYQYAPAVGDLNNDNVIDRADRALLEQNLFAPYQKALDVDQDGRLGVSDTAWLNLHQGVGVVSPAGTAYQELGQ